MSTQTQTSEPLILVVDDYIDSREMSAEYLSVCGFRTEQAGTGEEALRKATETLPNVILMDLTLPDIDGIEVTRRLKADPKTKDIAVIALTGHGEGEHSERARAAGCVAFLVKPCNPDAMVDEIRRVLTSGGKP